jgi:hypothetical protein
MGRNFGLKDRDARRIINPEAPVDGVELDWGATTDPPSDGVRSSRILWLTAVLFAGAIVLAALFAKVFSGG